MALPLEERTGMAPNGVEMPLLVREAAEGRKEEEEGRERREKEKWRDDSGPERKREKA